MSNRDEAAKLARSHPSTALVFAVLALADAVDGLTPPPEPTVPDVPFEQTREGWTWEP